MKYIGNIPEQNIIITDQDRYDYVSPENPTLDVNPSTLYATWLNTTTGEIFVCKSNEVDSNVWVGQLGSYAPYTLEGIPNNPLLYVDTASGDVSSDSSGRVGTWVVPGFSGVTQSVSADKPLEALYGGRKSVYFDGTLHKHLLTDITTNYQSITIFVAMVASNKTGGVSSMLSKSSYFAVNDSDFPFQLYHSDGLVYLSVDAGGDYVNDITLTADAPPNTPLVVCAEISPTGVGAIRLYMNGILAGEAGGVAMSSTSYPFVIGSSSYENGGGEGLATFKGHLFEVLMFDTILSASDRELVEQRLISKWGAS